MGKTCVAAGCSNTNKDGVSLHFFPKDPALKKKWVDQVKRHRDKWSPTAYSVLCSKHFEQTCFTPDTILSQSLGLEKKRTHLKPEAVPTLFSKPVPAKRKQEVDNPSPKRRRSAYEKRQQCRIVKQAMEQATGKQQVREDMPTTHGHSQDHFEMVSGPNNAGIQVSPDCSNVYVQCHSMQATVGLQTTIVRMDASVQCSLLPGPPLSIHGTPLEDETLDIDEATTTESDDSSSGSDYMSDSNDDTIIDDPHDTEPPPVHCSKKFIVFEDQLLDLFTCCRKCGHQPTQLTTKIIGTYIHLKQHCSICLNVFTWDSQPFVKDQPAGNILLSAAILFSGALPTKVLHVFRNMGCATISERTFFDHQTKYLHPTISSVWEKHQAMLLSQLRKEKRGLIIGGDGRADSPGHSAKFGSYTVMELKKQIVLDAQLVQSNEVKGSYHMEMEGLVRAVNFLRKKKFKVATLVTDRHKQISKWVRENMPSTDHRYDIWHLAKSFKKKVDALAKEKDCEVVGEWKRSLVNHLYWSAVSTPDGNGELIRAKWMSLDNHIHNKHKGHGKEFPKCLHKALRGENRKKKWFKSHTKASEKISAIILNRNFCTDVKKLSPVYQTSKCEAFHSLVITFAPKSTAFSYHGMLSRLRLAMLHYNENNARGQAETKAGEKRYSISYPKYKSGGYIVRKIFEKSTYEYVEDLYLKLWDIAQGGKDPKFKLLPPHPHSVAAWRNRTSKKQSHNTKVDSQSNHHYA